MAYLRVAGPTPTAEDAPFWAFCRQGVLKFQRCTRCASVRHPPGPRCPKCRSDESEWCDAGPARLFSYTMIHKPRPELEAPDPYIIAIVEFPECGSVRLISNVVDAPEREQLRIGAPLELVWEKAENGVPLPRFKMKPWFKR